MNSLSGFRIKCPGLDGIGCRLTLFEDAATSRSGAAPIRTPNGGMAVKPRLAGRVVLVFSLPELLMAVVVIANAFDLAVGILFKGKSGRAASGIEKCCCAFGKKL
jgi:hypothetical protein